MNSNLKCALSNGSVAVFNPFVCVNYIFKISLNIFLFLQFLFHSFYFYSRNVNS